MFPFRRNRSVSRTTAKTRTKRPYTIERLEDRSLLTTFAVANLNDSGAGSFRQAILDANAHVGADVINFNIAGTISLKSTLPTVIGAVNIDGTTAPGFTSVPVVSVDLNNKAGLQFASGSAGSALRSLSIVDASASGVKINGVNNIQILGNFIGLGLDGSTIIANRNHGLEIVNSNNDVIGGTEDEDRNVISGNKSEGIYLSNT